MAGDQIDSQQINMQASKSQVERWQQDLNTKLEAIINENQNARPLINDNTFLFYYKSYFNETLDRLEHFVFLYLSYPDKTELE